MKLRNRGGRRGHEGFTLVEVLIGLSMALAVGTAGYTFSSATLKLYAENFSLNQTHMSARLPLDRIAHEVQKSGCPPRLLDKDGVDLAETATGPAAGIRFCVPASDTNYTIDTAAGPSSNTVSLRVLSGQAMPRVGDLLVLNTDVGIQSGVPTQLEITHVVGSSSPYTLTLKKTLKIDVPANNPASIVQQGAFVVQNGELRYYNTAIKSANSYRVLTQVKTNASPFSYPGDRRLLQINLEVVSGRFSSRVNSFNSFLNLKSSVGARSSYLDSNNVVRSTFLDCGMFNKDL